MRYAGLLLLLLGCATPGEEVPSAAVGDSEYLYLWTASTDSASPDFLAVLDVRPDTGRMVRSSSGMGPGVPAGLSPYSGAVVPALDRIVTSTTDMVPKSPYKANQVQIWRLSDLGLLHTITLPAARWATKGT